MNETPLDLISRSRVTLASAALLVHHEDIDGVIELSYRAANLAARAALLQEGIHFSGMANDAEVKDAFTSLLNSTKDTGEGILERYIDLYRVYAFDEWAGTAGGQDKESIDSALTILEVAGQVFSLVNQRLMHIENRLEILLKL